MCASTAFGDAVEGAQTAACKSNRSKDSVAATRAGLLQYLPWEVRNRAHMRLHRFCKRWGRDLPRWRFAVLVGGAKRLTLRLDSKAALRYE